MSSTQHAYVLSNTAPAAEIKRLQQVDDFMRRTTQRHLEQRGLGPNWRCLEVGAGVGGVARFMAERVGPGGYVTAIDLRPLFEADPRLPQLEVRQHDILEPGLADGFYDLVHCRLLLINVGNAELALQRMVAALKPGGWLVVEEPGDTRLPDIGNADRRVAEFQQLFEQFLATLQQRTGAIELGLFRRLPQLLHTAGLVQVGGEHTNLLVDAAGRGALLSTLQAMDAVLEGHAFVTEGKLARLTELCVDPSLLSVGGATLSMWGQRPAA
jgi:SAM-dependent methyltransferase